jgi:hypothetical protein
MDGFLLFLVMVLWFDCLPDLNPGEVGCPAGACNAYHAIGDGRYPSTEPSPLTFPAAVVVPRDHPSLQRNAESLWIIVLPEICIHGVLAARHSCHFDLRTAVPSKRMNHFCSRLVRRWSEHDTGIVNCTVVTNKVGGIIPLPPVAVNRNSGAVEIDSAIEFPFPRLESRAAQLLDRRAQIFSKRPDLNRRLDRIAADIQYYPPVCCQRRFTCIDHFQYNVNRPA